jgi:hypothetical protein
MAPAAYGGRRGKHEDCSDLHRMYFVQQFDLKDVKCSDV